MAHKMRHLIINLRAQISKSKENDLQRETSVAY